MLHIAFSDQKHYVSEPVQSCNGPIGGTDDVRPFPPFLFNFYLSTPGSIILAGVKSTNP